MGYSRCLLNIFIVILITFSVPVHCYGVLKDRVVAFIDNKAITLSDLEDQLSVARKVDNKVTNQEIINNMINRVLLLREASRFRIEAKDEETLIKEYINLKHKASVYVKEDEIRKFYTNNREEFSGLTLFEARGKIEEYLYNVKVNRMLQDHLEELKSQSYIKILLDEP